MDLKTLDKIAQAYAVNIKEKDVPKEQIFISKRKEKILFSLIDNVLKNNKDIFSFAENLLKLKVFIYGDPDNDIVGEIYFTVLTKSFHEEFMLSESIWEWVSDIILKKSQLNDKLAMELISNELQAYLDDNAILN